MLDYLGQPAYVRQPKRRVAPPSSWAIPPHRAYQRPKPPAPGADRGPHARAVGRSKMAGHGGGAPLGMIATALAVALAIAPLVRGTTAELTRTLGTAWPFALAHCHVASTPGCK